MPEWAGLLPVSQLAWSGGRAELRVRLGVGGRLNPRPAAPGTPIPVRGRIGNRGFTVSISPAFLDSGESGNGEIMIPVQVAGKTGGLGIGNPIS